MASGKTACWMIYLKLVERTEKGLTLKNDNMTVALDSASMRAVIESGTTKKATNVKEMSTEVDASSAVSVTYPTGRFTFVGYDGPIINWIEQWKDGTTFKMTEESVADNVISLRDSVRGALIELDLAKKVMTYDDGSKKKPPTYKITGASSFAPQ